MDIKDHQEQFKLNRRARSSRHRRVFVRSANLGNLFKTFISLIVPKKLAGKRIFAAHLAPLEVKDQFSAFVRHSVVFVIALFIVTSISPARVLETGFSASFIGETEFLEGHEEGAEELPPLFINEEGFVLKTSPVSEDVSRIGYTDSVGHTVVSGETLSSIASLYGVKVSTIMWENKLSDYSVLKVGQTITIPSVDGVSHAVASDKETLGSIAKEYGVDEKLIVEHNQIEGDTIIKGQKLFIPGGKKKVEPLIVRTSPRTGGRVVDTFSRKIVTGSTAKPTDGKKLIFPTTGQVTQGFRAGHYAYDIGNRSKPDIWAATDGTVIKAAGGCPPRTVRVDRGCNGGYGNHVVIDHGNGLQTLYAHMETLYVSSGQAVGRGQAVGKMGDSGRTFGATGIHLHFEVIHKGTKQSPGSWF